MIYFENIVCPIPEALSEKLKDARLIEIDDNLERIAVVFNYSDYKVFIFDYNSLFNYLPIKYKDNKKIDFKYFNEIINIKLLSVIDTEHQSIGYVYWLKTYFDTFLVIVSTLYPCSLEIYQKKRNENKDLNNKSRFNSVINSSFDQKMQSGFGLDYSDIGSEYNIKNCNQNNSVTTNNNSNNDIRFKLVKDQYSLEYWFRKQSVNLNRLIMHSKFSKINESIYGIYMLDSDSNIFVYSLLIKEEGLLLQNSACHCLKQGNEEVKMFNICNDNVLLYCYTSDNNLLIYLIKDKYNFIQLYKISFTNIGIEYGLKVNDKLSYYEIMLNEYKNIRNEPDEEYIEAKIKNHRDYNKKVNKTKNDSNLKNIKDKDFSHTESISKSNLKKIELEYNKEDDYFDIEDFIDFSENINNEDFYSVFSSHHSYFTYDNKYNIFNYFDAKTKNNILVLFDNCLFCSLLQKDNKQNVYFPKEYYNKVKLQIICCSESVINFAVPLNSFFLTNNYIDYNATIDKDVVVHSPILIQTNKNLFIFDLNSRKVISSTHLNEFIHSYIKINWIYNSILIPSNKALLISVRYINELKILGVAYNNINK